MEDHLREMLMSDKIAEDIRRELLHHALLVQNINNFAQLVECIYPHLEGEYYIIRRSYGVSLEFEVPPGQLLGDHKEKLRDALVKHGLKYASQPVRDDKDLVLAAIAKHPRDLKYLSQTLKNDDHVVLAAVTQEGSLIGYASERLRDNETLVKTAVAGDLIALRYASERIRGDKKIILGLIQNNPLVFTCVGQDLKDYDFIQSAIDINPEVRKYVPKPANY